MATTSNAAGQSQTSIHEASTYQRLHPRAYLEKFLEEGMRTDGRKTSDWRDVQTGSISTAEGSALVRLGQTTVVCGVKAEIAEPALDRANHGFIVPNLDLPALCSPKFKPGPPSEESQILSDRLNDILITSKALDPTSLCIRPGKAVWTIYLDAICINYDGNVLDAALLAMVAALRITRLPAASYNEETNKTTCTRQNSVPLQLRNTPYICSFGLFDLTHLLSDPTSFEEPLLDTTISIVLDQTGQVISVLQEGLAAVASENSNQILRRCIEFAKQRLIILTPKIEQR
ncbi:hypothetical protein SISSUDRAFT_1071149 [Sistotremastrum suecicum HHB10207 ss-3]|uniref:Ribosomal RNA-processing protein 43 n=1 Tax=Sistotremastrum suecicum HHB10207 ss-3 TaxID=1314776 RepID=A0A166CII7_9AGAM|nr:hypothetical protein SISSUDRAFT_1071149 [Sistotremastrum suecicum HHB10207 ss-3]